MGNVLIKAKYYEEDVKTIEIDPSDIVNYRSHRPILKDLDPSDVDLVVKALNEYINPKLPEVKVKEREVTAISSYK